MVCNILTATVIVPLQHIIKLIKILWFDEEVEKNPKHILMLKHSFPLDSLGAILFRLLSRKPRTSFPPIRYQNHFDKKHPGLCPRVLTSYWADFILIQNLLKVYWSLWGSVAFTENESLCHIQDSFKTNKNLLKGITASTWWKKSRSNNANVKST